MAKHYLQGEYHPKNAEKYIGNHVPMLRSSWEFTLAVKFDENPVFKKWASEPFAIQYIHPFTNKITRYFPDFYVEFVDKTGKYIKLLIEVKPQKETFLEKAKSKRDKAALAVNYRKWLAAKDFCDKHGITFKIMTEAEIFGMK